MDQPAYALVTGASSGIGEHFARALAARRRNLALVARSRDKLESLAEEVRRAHGVLAEALPFDLSSPGAASGLTAALEQRGIEVDLLVNNAGFGTRGEFAKRSLERESEMIRLNVQAVVELTHRLLAPMIAKRHGSIINVSSTASFQPVPWTTVYAATKAFVTSFSLALAEEVRQHGIVVVTLCPGGTETNFFEASHYGTRKVPGGLQPAREVVDAALGQLVRGGGLVVPRLFNKLGVFVQRFLPRSLVMKVTSDLFRPAKDAG